MRTTMLTLVALCGLPAAGSAADLPTLAEAPAPAPGPSGFYAHVGAAGLIPDAGAAIRLGGVRVQGASIRVPATATAAAEVGYHITPNWAVSVSAGVPPTSEVFGTGTIAAFGKLGTSVAGPVAVTAHYHVLGLGAFQPYLGGGATYLVVFDSTDRALSRYRLDDAFGAVGQVGADLMLTERVGVFVDLKKAYLRTTARGALAGLPVKADVRLDPTALSGGVVVRF